MSDVKVEATEPNAAATSISNDQTVKIETSNATTPTDIKPVKLEAEQENSAEKEETKKSEQEDVDVEKNGEAAPHKNGNFKNDSPRRREYKKYDRGGDYQYKRRNESKYDPSVLSPSDDPGLIRGQVEFYFGDSNLSSDKNLWQKTDGSSNKPVDLHHVHNFKRMQRFQPYEKIVAALRESAFLDVVGEEGHEMVKRKVPYNPGERRPMQVEKRSIYAKGFGDEDPTTQFDIEAFFAPYGPLNAVRLRRTDDNHFKGSVFVEFHDDQTQEKFIALDPKPLWKGKDALEISTKAAYCARKMQEIEDGITQPKESYSPRGRGGYRGRGRGGNFRGDKRDRDGHRGRDRGDRDPDDWKKRREDDRASGFKDHRGNRKDRDRRGGRGRRDDRGPRRDDRNRERENGQENKQDGSLNERKRSRDEGEDDGAPAAKKVDVKTEENKSESVESPPKNDTKSAREDVDMGQDTPLQNVDSKPDVAAEVS